MDAAFIWNLSKLGRIGSRRLQFDDDFADRLNYQYTSVLLFLFIGLIGVRQYVGKPIQCWIPQEFTRGWEEYAENYCWVANTYFAPVHDRLPPVPDRRELLLVYYQWAPIVMAAQALLFYLPCLTWRLGMAHSGFNLHRILQMAAETNEMIPETARKTVAILAHYIRNCIQRHRVAGSPICRIGVYTRLEKEEPKQSTTLFDTVVSVRPSSKASSPDDVIDHGYEETSTRLTAPQMDIKGNRSKHACSELQSPDGMPNRTTVTHLDVTTHNSQSGRIRKPAPPPPTMMSAVGGSLQKQRGSADVVRIDHPRQQSGDMSNGQGSRNGQNHAKSKEKSCDSNGTTVKDAKLAAEKHSVTDTPAVLRFGCKHGNFLIALYLVVKVCYVINVIGQIYLMQSFIGTEYTWYGARVLMDLMRGREWHHSGHFPRVTFCDLEAKKLGKNHIYTLQCVLPLNMFLEKIYIFLWFWHAALAIVTSLSLFVWIHRVLYSKSRVLFIYGYLKPLHETPIPRQLLTDFVDTYLGLDGLFILRLISTNCGGLLVSDLVYELWQAYRDPSLRSVAIQTRANCSTYHTECPCVVNAKYGNSQITWPNSGPLRFGTSRRYPDPVPTHPIHPTCPSWVWNPSSVSPTNQLEFTNDSRRMGSTSNEYIKPRVDDVERINKASSADVTSACPSASPPDTEPETEGHSNSGPLPLMKNPYHKVGNVSVSFRQHSVGDDIV